jgi:hypothetical protein
MQSCKSLQAAENKTGFVACHSTLVLSHTDTLHQPVETRKKAGKMTHKINTFFHIHQGMFMWNETGRGVQDHHSLFQQ